MSIARAKPIDDLYEECSGYDLVVVPDAPLASAVNRRLDRAHFGAFATTPRRLAAGRRETAEDRLAFLELVNQTDVDWKDAANAVGNVLQCWEHQGRPDAILGYDRFDDEATRTAVEHLSRLPTTSRRLTDYAIDDDRSVAVVGIDQLTPLERSILPEEFATVDPFAADDFEHPPFRIFDSSAAVVDTLLDAATVDTADEIAVVLDGDSRYSSLVEAGFEAEGIPHYGGPGFVDDPDRRAFVGLLRSAYAGRDTRVTDVRPVLARLGIDVNRAHDDKRVCDLDGSGVDWLRDFQASIGGYTFEAALAAYERASGTALERFREELDALGVADERVTDAGVDRLAFYLRSYDVPVDRENEGVLLADAKSAAHVDRPVVFYLGLDQGWTRSSPRRPWVDGDRVFERNLRAFQMLLQSGVDQYYLVQDAAGGSPVTPCLYFEELLDADFERFSDLDSIPHARTTRGRATGFETGPVDVDPAPIETISQSSLNTYVNCPREYLFDRLVDSPDRDYFVEGNLFHDFAECYAQRPDAIDAEAVDEVVDLLLREVGPFVREADRDVRRTRYRVGLETLVEFLDANPPEGDRLLTPASWSPGNDVADLLGLSVEGGYTERWFEDEELGLKGFIDLVHGPGHLVDYKSGSRKSANRVVTRSALDPPGDAPNFQALAYLTYLRRHRPDDRLQFTFVHFLEALADAVTGDASLDDCLATITYYPRDYTDHVAGESVFEELQEDAPNDCAKTFSQVDYERYRAVVDANPVPDGRDRETFLDSDLRTALTAAMREAVGEYRYVEKGCAQALRHLHSIRNENYFADDLDAFETFVADQLAEINRRRAGEERFPVRDLGPEPNERYLDHRDLILRDR